MTTQLDTSGLLDNGKNSKQVVCIRCKSKMLPSQLGTYEVSEFSLESMTKGQEGEKEVVSQFYRVEDMFDFDNIGFTNTVENKKFLSCADCDVGPLGYHDLETKKSFLALSRVAYAE